MSFLERAEERRKRRESEREARRESRLKAREALDSKLESKNLLDSAENVESKTQSKLESSVDSKLETKIESKRKLALETKIDSKTSPILEPKVESSLKSKPTKTNNAKESVAAKEVHNIDKKHSSQSLSQVSTKSTQSQSPSQNAQKQSKMEAFKRAAKKYTQPKPKVANIRNQKYDFSFNLGKNSKLHSLLNPNKHNHDTNPTHQNISQDDKEFETGKLGSILYFIIAFIIVFLMAIR